MDWYYADENDQQVSVDPERLGELVVDGTLNRDTLVWNESLPEWTALATVRTDLFDGTPIPPALTPSQVRGITPVSPAAGAAAPIDTLAICSLVFGVLGILCIQLFAIPAVICGHIALKRSSDPGSNSANKGLSLAGVITGYMGLAFLVLLILYFVVIFAVGVSSGDFN